MTDFVLEQRMTTEQVNISSFQQIQNYINTYYDRVYAYTQFLKQPLKLGMFVPCDDKGNVLEDLKYCCDGKHCGCMGMPVNVCSHKQIDEYYIAKDRVLFKGFEIHNRHNVIKRGLGIVIVFSGIISILIDGNNGLGGFSKNDATIEDLVILFFTTTVIIRVSEIFYILEVVFCNRICKGAFYCILFFPLPVLRCHRVILWGVEVESRSACRRNGSTVCQSELRT